MTTTPRHLFAALACALALGVLATGCGSGGGSAKASAEGAADGKITVSDATIDWPANPEVAAVRMVVHNATATDDALIGVSSPVADRAMVHRTETSASGNSTMTPMPKVDLPARSSVTFEPGGLHVMLTDVTADLQVGDHVEVTLDLERAPDLTFTATVIEPGTGGTDGGSHEH